MMPYTMHFIGMFFSEAAGAIVLWEAAKRAYKRTLYGTWFRAEKKPQPKPVTASEGDVVKTGWEAVEQIGKEIHDLYHPAGCKCAMCEIRADDKDPEPDPAVVHCNNPCFGCTVLTCKSHPDNKPKIKDGDIGTGQLVERVMQAASEAVMTPSGAKHALKQLETATHQQQLIHVLEDELSQTQLVLKNTRASHDKLAKEHIKLCESKKLRVAGHMAGRKVYYLDGDHTPNPPMLDPQPLIVGGGKHQYTVKCHGCGETLMDGDPKVEVEWRYDNYTDGSKQVVRYWHTTCRMAQSARIQHIQ